MQSVTIKTLYQQATTYLEQAVEIRGWVRTRRDSKAQISFVTVSDGSCFEPLQVVVPASLENYTRDVLHLTAGCAVIVRGSVVATTGREQAIELNATAVELVGGVEDPEQYPISPKHHSLEYLREVLHLRPRTNTIGAVTRIRHRAAQAIHQFFDEQGFMWVHTPLITASDCEGAGEMFRVSTLDLENLPRTPQGKVDFAQDFFAKETFLTVSGQLNVEAYCLALSKVYTFGPTFRAENSNTSRHLAEFWMIEPEIAFADLADDMKLAENLLKYVFEKVLATQADDMAFFAKRVDSECIQRLERILTAKFEVMTYTDAIKLLEKAPVAFNYPVQWGVDLQSEHERYITEQVVKGPTIIINYPEAIKGFYMRLNDDGKTVAAMDVLVPGIGEIIGGSQREERLTILDQRLRAINIDPQHYDWYRDLRRYGTVPHAGFGLGFERLISYITGLNNVRDVIPFPRTPRNANN